MRKIKIAQIGINRYSHGRDILNCIKNLPDYFELVGYALPENEREKFPDCIKVFEGYREMSLDEILNNPDIEAVTIETEEKYLTKYALMAAPHKKHIHIEKPGGTELSDFEKLIETVKKNETVFHTGYMYRYNPSVIELKEQIKNGELGDIKSVEAHMSCIHPVEVRKWLGDYKGGMMFFLGCHLVDLVLSIQGEPQNIIPLNKCSGIDGIMSEDMGMAVFEYDNGVSFVKTSAVEIGGFERRQLVVSGSKKTVELKPLEWYDNSGNLVTKRHTYDSKSWHTSATIDTSIPVDRYINMMQSFHDMVIGKKQNPWSYDYELKLYKTILKACGNNI